MNKAEYREMLKFIDQEIDIEGIDATEVVITSWCHSGPVSVSLKGVTLGWLLSKVGEKLIRGWLEWKERDRE